MRDVLLMADEVLNARLFDLAGTPITLATVITFALIVAIAYWSSRLVQRAVVRAFRIRGIRDPGTVGITRRLAHYIVLAIGLAVALETVGIDLAALFAAGAVFAVAIGFAMQNIAQNFVSGLILLFERTIKPGDVLEVGGQVVQVQRLGFRSTVARSRDEEELIIPNGILVQSTVTNYTLRDSLYRLRATVGVAYASDMTRVKETLEAMARSLSWRTRDKEPWVLLKEFGDSAVNFEVYVWIEDPWYSRIALSDLNMAVWRALRDAGITIAFPQVDLHLDEPVVESLNSLKPAG